MSTLVDNPTFGTEMLARQAIIVLIDRLNDALPLQDLAWVEHDMEIDQIRGIDYEPRSLELIDLKNFHIGMKPSLLNADLDGYPNVSVYSDRADAAPINDYDHQHNYVLPLFVEVMVKSENEEVVNARAQRTADAVNQVILSNPSLRGKFQNQDGTPEVRLTEVQVRNANTSYGSEWYWQGAQIEYAVRKESLMPTGTSSFPATTSAPDFPGADIDQLGG